MPRFPLLQVIAERRLQCREGPMMVRIGVPRQDGGAWASLYAITWPGGMRAFNAKGEDAVQALSLCLNAIAVDLAWHNELRELDITWDGSRDLGFSFSAAMLRSLRDSGEPPPRGAP